MSQSSAYDNVHKFDDPQYAQSLLDNFSIIDNVVFLCVAFIYAYTVLILFVPYDGDNTKCNYYDKLQKSIIVLALGLLGIYVGSDVLVNSQYYVIGFGIVFGGMLIIAIQLISIILSLLK